VRHEGEAETGEEARDGQDGKNTVANHGAVGAGRWSHILAEWLAPDKRSLVPESGLSA
jgi:hypothetical protein